MRFFALYYSRFLYTAVFNTFYTHNLKYYRGYTLVFPAVLLILLYTTITILYMKRIVLWDSLNFRKPLSEQTASIDQSFRL